MDVALEDVNLLLSDLELGMRNQAEDSTFAKSSNLVVEQVRILEEALLEREDQDKEAAAEGIRRDAGIVDVAIARGMPRPAGGIDDATARAEALSFMRSELQVLCIEAHRRRQQNQPLLAGLKLTSAQRQTVDRVHASIAADFALRRRMLLRRCDVTVQSFLRDSDGGGGGKKMQGGGGAEAGGAAGGGGGCGGGDEEKFASLPPALRTKRQALSDEPRRITVGDALAAPVSLAWQHAQKITEGCGGGGAASSTKASTSIKAAEIAEVSDRGGRVGDARGGPTWKTQKEFDKAAAAGRGRGGRGGGGGGRGGGGGGGGGGGSGGGGGGGGRSGRRGGRKGGGSGGGGGQETKEGGNRGGGRGGRGEARGEGGDGGGNKRKWGRRGDRASR